jgi:replication factor C large subunit
MLLEKYKPKTTKEIIGNALQINAIRNFLKNWKKGTALFLYGPTGVGKTMTVKLLAKEMGCQLVESYATDDRSYKAKNEFILLSKQKSMLFDKKLFLFDELELVDSIRMVSELIRESAFPIILVGGNPYDKKFLNIRKYLKIIKFQKPGDDEIAEFLTYVCKNENIGLERKDINQLARMCNGDLRAALIDLELLKILKGKIVDIGHREQIYDIFNLLKMIFKATSIDNVKTVFDSCENPDKLIRWVEENIANEFQDIKDIANAYNYLSKADLFHSRIINRQSWGLQKYYYNLSTLGMVSCKKSSFSRYNQPRFYFEQINNDILKKINSKLHISRKKSKEYVPLIKLLIKKGRNREEIIEKFGFDENDVEMLKTTV